MVIPIARVILSISPTYRLWYEHDLEWLENGSGQWIVVNLNTAYLDANNEKDFTAGLTRCGNVSSSVISTRTIR